MSVEEAIKNLNIVLDSARRRAKRNIVIPDLIETIEMAIEALETHDGLCDNLAWYINERNRLLKERDIIHCKDCEYFRTPEKYSYKEPNLYCCRSALVKVSENDFCSKAVRKR